MNGYRCDPLSSVISDANGWNGRRMASAHGRCGGTLQSSPFPAPSQLDSPDRGATVDETLELPHHARERRPRIDYVVVAYRSERHLGACLDAIEADRPDDSSVIVVDNASPDGSADVARGHRSRPRVIVSPTNLGFGGGCNLALEASSAEFIFLVNPDATLTRGATEGLMASIRADSLSAVAGPRIEDPAGDFRAASAGFEPSLRSALGHFWLLARLPLIGRSFPPLQLPFGSQAQAVDWVSGAAFMVQSDAFREVGGFDPSIFLYMEDVDLCRRLRGIGRTIRYEPSVAVKHELGGSQGTEQAERWFTAFHRYLALSHGNAYARACSAVVAIGLGPRAAVLGFRDPARGRRLARAAWTAAGLAVRIRSQAEGPAGA